MRRKPLDFLTFLQRVLDCRWARQTNSITSTLICERLEEKVAAKWRQVGMVLNLILGEAVVKVFNILSSISVIGRQHG
jgi:hypothetical protein